MNLKEGKNALKKKKKIVRTKARRITKQDERLKVIKTGIKVRISDLRRSRRIKRRRREHEKNRDSRTDASHEENIESWTKGKKRVKKGKETDLDVLNMY